MGPDAEGELTNHVKMAKTKIEEKQLSEGPKSPKKKKSVDILFHLLKRTITNKSSEGKFQKKYKPQ